MGRQKYFTEEERKAAQRENAKRWRKKHPEYAKQYNQDHKDEKSEYNKHYREKNPEYMKQYVKQYRKEHKEEMTEYVKRYQKGHKDEIAEQRKRYLKTPKGRAVNLVDGYRQNDKKRNRGECTITSEWIVVNVFSGQCCHYCGESDWKKLGCDRLDNNLPHTPENCVPCCCDCNVKKHTTEYNEFMRLIGKIE